MENYQAEMLAFEDLELLPLFDRGVDDFRVDFDASDFARADFGGDGGRFEKQIAAIWEEKTKANSRIYNATKFRLHRVVASGKSGKGVTFQVGMTDYREMLGTHYAPNAREIVETTAKTHPGDRYRCMSNAIGVGAITETSDGWILLVHRAGWTGEHAGWIDRPGGHPEPETVKKVMEAGKAEVAFDLANLDPGLILKEILESPQTELRDEVNVPLTEQRHRGLLGVIRDLGHGGRVGLDSHVRTPSLSREAAEAAYASGGQDEADETQSLVFVEVDTVKKWDFEAGFYSRMTPHCRAGLRLLHMKLNEK